MDKFTVEEINLMCVFEGQDRTGMIADIKNVIPHIQDSVMVELAGQIFGNSILWQDSQYSILSLLSFFILLPHFPQNLRL